MDLEFEDIPLMIAGKPFGRFDGVAEIYFGYDPHDAPEVVALWLYSDVIKFGHLKRTLVDVRALYLTEGQRACMQTMILSEYANTIDDARRAHWADVPREIEPSQLLQSEMR